MRVNLSVSDDFLGGNFGVFISVWILECGGLTQHQKYMQIPPDNWWVATTHQDSNPISTKPRRYNKMINIG